jgi:hypothetical protein
MGPFCMIGIHEALDALDGTALPSRIDICRVALCSYLGIRELKDEGFHYWVEFRFDDIPGASGTEQVYMVVHEEKESAFALCAYLVDRFRVCLVD